MAGDMRIVGIAVSRAMFQSTPAHGGRLASLVGVPNAQGVSIHARAWRATGPAPFVGRASGVSIHARAWRATPCECYCRTIQAVSIDARAWRATRRPRIWRGRCVFQSTPAHGGRLSTIWLLNSRCQFQSTPAHGGRLGRVYGPLPPERFNPRPRMAGDQNRKEKRCS